MTRRIAIARALCVRETLGHFSFKYLGHARTHPHGAPLSFDTSRQEDGQRGGAGGVESREMRSQATRNLLLLGGGLLGDRLLRLRREEGGARRENRAIWRGGRGAKGGHFWRGRKSGEGRREGSARRAISCAPCGGRGGGPLPCGLVSARARASRARFESWVAKPICAGVNGVRGLTLAAGFFLAAGFLAAFFAAGFGILFLVVLRARTRTN